MGWYFPFVARVDVKNHRNSWPCSLGLKVFLGQQILPSSQLMGRSFQSMFSCPEQGLSLWLHPQVIQEGHAGPAWSQKGSLDQSRALVWALPIRPAVSFLRDAMLFPAPSIPTFYKPGSFNKPAFSWAHLAAEKGCQAGRSLAWAFAGALQDLASVYALTSVGESDVPVVGVLTANTVPCRRRR